MAKKVCLYLIALIMTPVSVNAEIIYGINSNNTALISFDTTNGATETIESFNFYSQGQLTYNLLDDKIYMFDGGNDKIITYNLKNNSGLAGDTYILGVQT